MSLCQTQWISWAYGSTLFWTKKRTNSTWQICTQIDEILYWFEMIKPKLWSWVKNKKLRNSNNFDIDKQQCMILLPFQTFSKNYLVFREHYIRFFFKNMHHEKILKMHSSVVKSTSVKKVCTKFKRTLKFGVEAICKIDFVALV